MEFSAAQIAMITGGKTEGNAAVTVTSFGKIEEAKQGQLAFLANPKYEDFIYSTKASVIIINESLELRQAVEATLIRVPDAYSSFAALLHKYQQLVTEQLSGIQQPSYVSATASLGENVFIGAFVYLGENVVIENNAKLFPGVFIGNNVKVGVNTDRSPRRKNLP